MGVQINGDTGNISATKADYSGNVTIGGTLTYEDVTNIDSVGLVTARSGIEVGARPGVAASISVDGNMIVSGITTIGGVVNASSNIKVGSGVTLSPDGDGFFTGVVTATSYSGSGANLTGISAGIVTSNAASMSGITTVLDLSKDDFKITVSGITTVDVRGGSEGSSHTLRIHNSGITTVGFSTYFLFPSGAAPIIPTADGTISLISFTVDRQGAVGLATQLLAGSSVNFS